MAHSLVFKHISGEDINATRFQTFKKWSSNHTDFSGSFGVQIWKGILDEDWGKYDYPDGFVKNLPNPDGRDQKSLWYQVNGMYYKEGKTNLDIEYSSYMLRRLHDELAYVQLPQQYTGEGIKLGSLLIESGPLFDDDLTPGGPGTASAGHGVDGTVELFSYDNDLFLNGVPNDEAHTNIIAAAAGTAPVNSYPWQITTLPYTVTPTSNTNLGGASLETKPLWFSGFGFDIPLGSVIDKVEHRVNHQATLAGWNRHYSIDSRLTVSSSNNPAWFQTSNVVGPGYSFSSTGPAPLVADDIVFTYDDLTTNGGNIYNYNNGGPTYTGFNWPLEAEQVNDPGFGVMHIVKYKNDNTLGANNVYQVNEMEVTVYYTDPQGIQRIQIRDDKLGNLIDRGIDTGSMVSSNNLLAYWGFNDKFKYRKQLYKSEAGTVSNVLHHSDLSYQDITFAPGIKTTGTVQPSGLKAQFNGNGFMWLEDELQQYNFDFKANFSISLWVELPTTQTNVTGSTNFIMSKQGDVVSTLINKISNQLPQWDGYESEGVTTQRKIYTPYLNIKYPFAIKVHNQTSATPGRIEVSKCDIQNTPTIISNVRVDDNNQHHIVFQKDGENLELWIDGILEGTTKDTTLDSKLNTHNDAILSIGSEGYDRGQLIGNLDEIRIYDRGLTDKEIISLGDNDYVTGTAYNTAIVGNVFYPQGTLVISDPRPKYKKILLGNNFDYTSSLRDNFKLEYRSTLTLTEQEVVCRVGPEDFNFTVNPTIREYTDMESPSIKDYATGSDWHPYVTTIGLFDQYGRMLAIGKTAQAIPIYDNIETTFLVRYDE